MGVSFKAILYYSLDGGLLLRLMLITSVSALFTFSGLIGFVVSDLARSASVTISGYVSFIF